MPHRNEIVGLTHEQAYDEADKLSEKTEHHADGVTIIKGKHPQHGSVILIIPPFGEVMQMSLQPMAIHNADETMFPNKSP